jgi:tRNA(Ile2)-agmatinylcytidine synthase
MGWLGLDDTDHLGGGCTTKSLDELIKALPKDVSIGELRLVRLWPFAKHRTRGNAAVAVELICDNEDRLVAHLDSWWHAELKNLAGKITSSDHDDRIQYPAEPGMVWFSSQMPNSKFYYDAVSREVNIEELPSSDESWGGQGRIGAYAAVSWDKVNITYEAIAWREEVNTGKGNIRKIDDLRLQEVDKMEETFMSRDSRTGNSLIAPRGPCPVLFGIRARNYEIAKNAANYLLSSDDTEKDSGFRVFTTNQASDDHLGENMRLTVDNIEVLSRGAVVISCQDKTLMAFAESGEIKLLAQWLKSGDEIEFNGLFYDDNIIHLERLRVSNIIPDKVRPICKECNVKMKSMGRNQPVRCPKCRIKSDVVWSEQNRIPPFTDWVQAPLNSRRHLSKPLEW